VTTTRDDVETPTLRRTARRTWPWIALMVVVVLVGVVLVVFALRPQASSEDLAADNPGPNGAQALAEVLRQHGVDVVVSHSLARTEGAIRDVDDTTVLLSDPHELLRTAQRERLRATHVDLVLVQPGFATLGDLAPDVGSTGTTEDDLTADCSVAAVQKAGTVSGGAQLYEVGDDGVAASCLRTKSGAALIQLRDDGVTTTVLGAAAALRNDTIAQDGDAALALNLLGTHRTLVWYTPGYDDLATTGSGGQSLADLTPPWVTPLVLLLFVAGLGAVLWRGRRLGRVVVERMPVVVRSSETMEGRARLYERASARVHALDAIRIGTVTRLGRLLGMPRSATVDEIADAVAAVTGRPRAEVSAILIDELPTGDARLISLSDALLRLEQDTARALRS
jgi:hypothetical protein